MVRVMTMEDYDELDDQLYYVFRDLDADYSNEDDMANMFVPSQLKQITGKYSEIADLLETLAPDYADDVDDIRNKVDFTKMAN